ncbi:ATP-binding cassette domain-containing protein [Mycoplasmopsis hyopharyngis]|uniref:ABC transporter ATP-binding protein n=1 Tax=Mycoplasmopsis hyopharyngis TaxID=29558 RepID=UPI003872D4D9
MENAIEIKNLTKIFNEKSKKRQKIALNSISFNVPKGSFHGFIGNNGSGKTTTFRSILGLYPDVKGEIYINGISFKNEKSREKIGYIPEIAIFPKNLTIKEYVQYFAELSGMKKAAAQEKANDLLKKFNFDSKEFNKSATKLSSGQKKKVLLMQALVNDPEILILDEPAANLDPSARIELYKELKELSNEGKTIFLSSHILLELEQYIDSYTILADGQVIDSGKIDEKLSDQKLNKKIIMTNVLEEQKDEIKKIFEKHASEFEIKEKENEYWVLFSLKKPNETNKLLNDLLKKELNIKQIADNKVSLNELYFSQEGME